MARERIVITGAGAVCASGMGAETIMDKLLAGVGAIGPIGQWDTGGWPATLAGEVRDFNARALVEDRKLHKLIRRTDLFGLYAAGQAIDASGYAAQRESLSEEAKATFSDQSGVYVGSGGGNYQTQYDYFPLMTEAGGDLQVFGRELSNVVNPMWLLRTLPNNVLCHVGIRHLLKGANACITNHSVGGTLAVIEAAEGLRTGEALRAVAVGHDAPIEPQMVLYYHRLGLVSEDGLRPFDSRHNGSLFGEGAGAFMLETQASAAARDALLLGEVLGGGYASEALGLVAIRDDGDGLARAIGLALEDAGVDAGEVGMIVAHGNGTPQSDASEAAAIGSVFGSDAPPTTAFKWAFGHLIAAAGITEAVLALAALRKGVVPGIANLERPAEDCRELRISSAPQAPRSDIALVLSRGFGGTDAALLIRAFA